MSKETIDISVEAIYNVLSVNPGYHRIHPFPKEPGPGKKFMHERVMRKVQKMPFEELASEWIQILLKNSTLPSVNRKYILFRMEFMINKAIKDGLFDFMLKPEENETPKPE